VIRDANGSLTRVTATKATVKVDRLAHSKSTSESSPSAVQSEARASAEFHFVGVKPLDQSSLRRGLERSQESVPSFKQEARAETLTPKEFAAVEEKHRDAPVPAGWHFDGTWYVDSWGEKSAHHPEMQKWIEEYLQTRNEQVKQHNEGVLSRRSSFVPLSFE
jgi:hypothetical protein